LVGIKLGDLTQGLQNIVSKFKGKSMNYTFETTHLFEYYKKTARNNRFEYSDYASTRTITAVAEPTIIWSIMPLL
jgi:hypothetical protein